MPISLAIALFSGPTQLSVACGVVKSGDGLVSFPTGYDVNGILWNKWAVFDVNTAYICVCNSKACSA